MEHLLTHSMDIEIHEIHISLGFYFQSPINGIDGKII